MATVQDPSKSVSRYERFVREELSKAVLRVRLLDLGQAALGLFIAVLVYGLGMMLADRWLVLPEWLRQLSLVGFLGFTALYGWFVLLRPIRRAINPYYAAVQVEQSIPDAKNSLVNWLDLHDENLAPSVATAIGQRAAEDLKTADVPGAIHGNYVVWLAGISLALVAAMIVAMFAFRTDQFASLLRRTFAPFSSQAIVRQTRLKIIAPEGGDATVPINRTVTIVARVDGRIPNADRPDAIKLLVRYNPDDPNYETHEMKASENDSAEWSARLAPHQVRTGFWYKVTGGDDETAEFRVQTRSSPIISRFEVLLKYRPYLRWEPRRTTNANIEDFRGTEVTLDAVTNREVREGKLLMETGGKLTPIIAELRPKWPNVMRFRFKLERDAKYRIWFTTTDDESNNDPMPYTVKVLQDMKPDVEFTRPEELKKPEPESDLAIPADGMLRLEGIARDDFGLRKLTLRMKLDGSVLKPKDYLTEKDYRLDTGGFMREIKYKDDVDLSKLELAGGGVVKPETGMVLEYWLEAEDNFDDPNPQVGSTRKYRVKFLPPKVREKPPANDEEKKEQENKKEERDVERKQAAQDKKDHDQKHEGDRQKQSEDDRKRQEERKQQQEQQDKKDQGGKGGSKDDPSNNRGKPDDPMNTGSDTKSDPADAEAQRKFEKIKEDLKNEQNKDDASAKPQDGGADGKAENKPAPADQPPSKPADAPKEPEGQPKKQPDAGSPGDPQKAADAKPSDPMNMGGGAGEAKAKPDEAQPRNGEDKKAGESSNDPSGMGDPKTKPSEGGEKGMSEAKAPPQAGTKSPMDKGPDGANQPKDAPSEPGQAKGQPKDPKPNQNQAGTPDDPMKKSQDQKPGDGGTGKSKPDNAAKAGSPKDSPKKNEAGNAEDNQAQANEPGAAKPKDSVSPKSAPKPDQAASKNQGKPNGEQKPGNSSDPKNADNAAQNKPQPAQDPMNKGEVAKGAAKPDQKGQGDQNAQKPDGAGGKDEIAKAAEQMNKGNAQQREEARQKLNEMAKNDADPQRRKAAEEALKDADKGKPGNEGVAKSPPQSKPGDPMAGDKPQVAERKGPPQEPGKSGDDKRADKGDSKVAKSQPKQSPQANQSQKPQAEQKAPPRDSDATCECKNPGGKSGESGQPKGGGKSGEGDQVAKGESKDGPKPGPSDKPAPGGMKDPNIAQNNKTGDPMNPMGTNPMGDGPGGKEQPGIAKNDAGAPGQGKANDDRPGEGAGNPGNGSDATRQVAGRTTAPETLKPMAANEENRSRAGELSLEDIDKQKLKKMFEKYNVTEEEWQRYREQQAKLKTAPGATPDRRDLEAGRTDPSHLNRAARRVEGTQEKDPTQLISGSSGQAPPEYKKAAEKFAEILAKPPEPRKK